MDATASSLGDLGDLLAKARIEAERGANETLSYEIRQTITAEIDEYFQQAVNIGNTEHLGRQIFAGYRVDQQPFVADLVHSHSDLPGRRWRDTSTSWSQASAPQ